MDYQQIILSVIGGAIIPSVVAYIKAKKITELETNHDREITELKYNHEKEITELKNKHDEKIRVLEHSHEMEVLKYSKEINTNSSEGINDMLGVMKSMGMNPEDILNNPEKIEKQINNLQKNSFVKKKKR